MTESQLEKKRTVTITLNDDDESIIKMYRSIAKFYNRPKKEVERVIREYYEEFPRKAEEP